MSTVMATAESAMADTKWHVIDADGKVLGRIATAAAKLLQGKHKPAYTPFIDTGDHVIVVNAAKLEQNHRSYALTAGDDDRLSRSRRRPQGSGEHLQRLGAALFLVDALIHIRN